MPSTIYTGPNGEHCINPADAAVDDLFSQGEDYWQDLRGRGHGSFDFVIDKYPIANLETTFANGFGYYVAVTQLDPQGHQQFVALNEDEGNGDVAKLHYGGEPFLVPRQMFHPAQTAAAVVKEFCRTGKRSAAVTWYRLAELDWDSTTGQWTPPRRR
jgi:hypothetical protein